MVVWIASTKTDIPTPSLQTEAPEIPETEIFTTDGLPSAGAANPGILIIHASGPILIVQSWFSPKEKSRT